MCKVTGRLLSDLNSVFLRVLTAKDKFINFSFMFNYKHNKFGFYVDVSLEKSRDF